MHEAKRLLRSVAAVILAAAGCAGGGSAYYHPTSPARHMDPEWMEKRETLRTGTGAAAEADAGAKEKAEKLLKETASERSAKETGVLKMSLAEAIGLALMKNHDIRMAKMEVEKARGEITAAKSAALPSLSLSASYVRLGEVTSFEVAPGVTVEFGEPDNYRAGLSLSQPIYLGGKARAALRIAKLYERLSKSGVRGAQAGAAMQVRSDYYGVLYAREVVETRAMQVSMARRHLEDVEIRRREGTALPLYVMRARGALSLAESGLIKARADQDAAGRELLRTLALPLDTAFELTSGLPEGVEGVETEDAFATALAARADYAAALESMAMQKENIGITGAAMKPNVVAFGEYGYEKPSSSNPMGDGWEDYWQAGVQLSWTLFDGNATRGNLIKERAELRRMEIERDRLLLQIRSEVEDAAAGLATASELVKAMVTALREAEETLRLAEQSYEAGTATQLDVFDAETGLRDARLGMAEARYALGMAYAGYTASLGLTELPGEGKE
ncbi:MAG: TolC family protein [Planctomycetes bacterium]|nr:TolC family protein [Planctomycetota bacterium]